MDIYQPLNQVDLGFTGSGAGRKSLKNRVEKTMLSAIIAMNMV